MSQNSTLAARIVFLQTDFFQSSWQIVLDLNNNILDNKTYFVNNDVNLAIFFVCFEHVHCNLHVTVHILNCRSTIFYPINLFKNKQKLELPTSLQRHTVCRNFKWIKFLAHKIKLQTLQLTFSE